MARHKGDGGPTFKPNRVRRGKAIGSREMTRRLAHYLHIPQRYGAKVMRALEFVIEDAMVHGEGIKIPSAGTLVLEEYDSLMYTGFGKIQARKLLFKYKWRLSKHSKKFLRYISALKRKGRIDDYFPTT